MKKILMAMVLAACLTLTACDKNTGSDNSGGTSSNETVAASPAEKTASLLGSVEFPEMRKLDTEEDLKAIFGIDAFYLTDYSAYMCPSGMAPDEFGVFVARDEDAAAAIKTAIESRIQYQSNTFRDYPLAAAEVYKLDDAFVEAKGNVVAYAICADNAKAEEILG